MNAHNKCLETKVWICENVGFCCGCFLDIVFPLKLIDIGGEYGEALFVMYYVYYVYAYSHF